MWKIPTPEEIERKRADDRERIARLRADPEYRDRENAIERERYRRRCESDPAYAERTRSLARLRGAKRRARLRDAAE